MKTAMLKTAILAGGLVMGQAALAATPIDEARPVAADARVKITNIAGSITVTGWDRDEVHVTGELGDGVESLEIDGDADQLTIEVRYPEGHRNYDIEPSRLEVSVPRGARLEASGVSADVAAGGLTGDVRLDSVSGDVQAELDTDRPARLKSVSGDLGLKGRAGGATLETVSGDIRAEGVSGDLRIKTVSGDAELRTGKLSHLEMESVSGELDAFIDLAQGAEVRIKSLSGEVQLGLPASASARIFADSYSGEIQSDFGSATKDGRRLDATAGGGDAEINIETFSGEVEIRRR